MQSPLSIQLTVPVQWHAASEVYEHSDGVLLLRVLSLMEASASHIDDDDSIDALRWHALEARVDLTLQLLGQLLLRGASPPPLAVVALSAESAVCAMIQPLTVGEVGTLALHLSPRIPQALMLQARVEQCVQQNDEHYAVHFGFIGMHPELQDWLAKTIFRRHRREIFERKHALDD